MLASGPVGASPGAGPGPAPFAKGGFLKDLVFHVLSRFSMPRARARAARPAWLGWAGTAPGCAEPARLPALCEIRLPSTL